MRGPHWNIRHPRFRTLSQCQHVSRTTLDKSMEPYWDSTLFWSQLIRCLTLRAMRLNRCWTQVHGRWIFKTWTTWEALWILRARCSSNSSIISLHMMQWSGRTGKNVLTPSCRNKIVELNEFWIKRPSNRSRIRNVAKRRPSIMSRKENDAIPSILLGRSDPKAHIIKTNCNERSVHVRVDSTSQV